MHKFRASIDVELEIDGLESVPPSAVEALIQDLAYEVLLGDCEGTLFLVEDLDGIAGWDRMPNEGEKILAAIDYKGSSSKFKYKETE